MDKGREGSGPMRAITLERGTARPHDLSEALDMLGVKEGENFVVMAESWRDDLNKRAVGLGMEERDG
jgi:hypothetical protein